MKIGVSSTSSGQTNVVGSAAAAVLRSDSGSGGPPPNVNIASLNLPGVFAGAVGLSWLIYGAVLRVVFMHFSCVVF